MNFTREPIIETIITPKEGFKLAVRNSKGAGQEELFVDALQVITIGQATFYSSIEKPKAFIVPVSDYEVLEVRETRVSLKTPGHDKGGIKIGGGRDTSLKNAKEESDSEDLIHVSSEEKTSEEEHGERKGEKKREKGRFRKKRDRHNKEEPPVATASTESLEEQEPKREFKSPEERPALIPPPSTLISETLAHYRHSPSYSNAFYEQKKEEELVLETQEEAPLAFEAEEAEFFPTEEPQISEDDETL